MGLTEFRLYIWGNTFIHISWMSIYYICISIPKLFKNSLFQEDGFWDLKVSWTRNAENVNISAWNPPWSLESLIFVLGSVTLWQKNSPGKAYLLCCQELLFRRLDEFFLIQCMMGFYLSSILIFYWVSLMFLNYINSLSDFNVCTWILKY